MRTASTEASILTLSAAAIGENSASPATTTRINASLFLSYGRRVHSMTRVGSGLSDPTPSGYRSRRSVGAKRDRPGTSLAHAGHAPAAAAATASSRRRPRCRLTANTCFRVLAALRKRGQVSRTGWESGTLPGTAIPEQAGTARTNMDLHFATVTTRGVRKTLRSSHRLCAAELRQIRMVARSRYRP